MAMKFTKTQKDRYKRIKRLEQMRKMDPVDFEHFVGWLYRQDGYSVGETAVTGDQGVDLSLSKWGQKTIVQCKRYSGTVGQPTVRDLYGAMHHEGAKEAHLVTTGNISRHAEDWAADKPIDLIDGHDLVAWVNRNRRSSTSSLLSGITPLTAGIALVTLVAFMALAGGWWFFTQRTGAPPTPIVQVPTRPADADPTAAPTGAATEPALAPTATLPGGTAPSGPISVARAETAPVIDGRLNEWGNIPAVTADTRVYAVEGWDGSQDVVGNWRLTWDSEYLYVGTNVIDDTLVQTQTGARSYQGDSLELQIDNAPRLNTTTIGRNTYQIALSPGGFNGRTAEAFLFAGTPQGTYSEVGSAGIIVNSQQTEDGYTIEARIPWSALRVTPAPGTELGGNLNVNDNDTPGTAVQEMMVSTNPQRTYGNPGTWGELVLTE